MKRLKAKLHSERGASILLALLMFLVCVMVAASVLAAAASNAGKVRSNRTEQQKFLNLSSAIQLVADEIQRAEYTGKYKVYKWDVTTTTTDNSTDPPTKTSRTDRYFYCEQVEGVYSCEDLTAQLPFGPKLDEIFGKQFKEKGAGFQALYDTPSAADQYDLRVTLDLTDDAPKGYEVPMEVTVRVKLDGNTHHILLTAWEGAEDNPSDMNKAMQAELVVKEGTAPVLDDSPGGRTAGDPSGRAFEEKTAAGAPMQWELHWIRKGEAAP